MEFLDKNLMFGSSILIDSTGECLSTFILSP